MIRIFAWHQIKNAPFCTKIEDFNQQLDFLKKTLPIISSLDEKKPNNCALLTFDDATIDFYTHVFPLLKKKQMPAVLAVPTGWIQPKSSLNLEKRLKLLQAPNPFTNYEAFCSVEELKEMQDSKLVTLASHGHLHKNLKVDPDFDELTLNLAFFEKHFQTRPSTFIFPYGAYDRSIIKEAKKHYKHLIRIGSCWNQWPNPKIYYRVVMDKIANIEPLFNFKNSLKFICKETLNRLRNH
jgi:peptidoglycan/xylan/chitin deacetylase (PgdA/CDA1 family)